MKLTAVQYFPFPHLHIAREPKESRRNNKTLRPPRKAVSPCYMRQKILKLWLMYLYFSLEKFLFIALLVLSCNVDSVSHCRNG